MFGAGFVVAVGGEDVGGGEGGNAGDRYWAGVEAWCRGLRFVGNE